MSDELKDAVTRSLGEGFNVSREETMPGAEQPLAVYTGFRRIASVYNFEGNRWVVRLGWVRHGQNDRRVVSGTAIGQVAKRIASIVLKNHRDRESADAEESKLEAERRSRNAALMEKVRDAGFCQPGVSVAFGLHGLVDHGRDAMITIRDRNEKVAARFAITLEDSGKWTIAPADGFIRFDAERLREFIKLFVDNHPAP